MNKFTALLLLAWMALVACDGSKTTSETGYMKTIMVWRGASAEQIREQLIVLPLLHRAVVYDGEATIFHQASKAEVMAELDQASKRWSSEISLSEVQAYEGILPEPPKPETEQRIEFHAKREVMSQHGITFSDLAEQMGEGFALSEENLILSASDGELDKKMITTPNGLAIPLADLGTIELKEIIRPLMIDMAGP